MEDAFSNTSSNNIDSSSSLIKHAENEVSIPDSNGALIPERQKKLPVIQLLALTISLLGVQCGWAIQIAFTSPIFLELGVPTNLVNFVWLAGPISGLLVQPTIGVISDSSTNRWGRRRPFILAGSLCIVVAMLFLSNSRDLGKLMGDTSTHHPRAIIIAVIGFWLLDLANNTVAAPCRALLMDVAAPSQQALGGSLFSFMLGFGNLLGYFLGSLNWTRYLPFMGSSLRTVFLLSIIVLMVCTMITVLSISEIPMTKDQIVLSKAHGNPFVRIMKGIYQMPKPMVRLCIVTFFTWVGWFTFFLYATTWVAINIYKGDPLALEGSHLRDVFDDGVRMGALALIINSAVSMSVSMFLPFMIKWIGLKPIYFFAMVIFSACLFMPLFITSVHGAMLLIAAFGIPWAVVMVGPFMVIASSVDEAQTGLYLGVLNIFVVIPQLLVAIGIGYVINYFHGNVVSALVVGGISAIGAAISVLFLIVEGKQPELVIISSGH